MIRRLLELFLWACLPLYFGNKADHSKNAQTTNVNDSSQILAAGGLAARDGGVINISETDMGAVKAATESLTTTTAKAFDFAGKGLTDLLSTQGAGLSGFMDAFDSLLGFATETQETAQLATKQNTALVGEAYQGARDSVDGNRTLMLVGLSIVGVVAVSMLFRKGA